MEMPYEDYEKQCQEIRKENAMLLELFKTDMDGLSPKTIQRHLNNVSFYINDYLLYEEPCTIQDGVSRLDDFLGYFFIRKCMWSTPATIKSTAGSIKKFYQSMLKHGKIGKGDYTLLCDDIKEGMPQWQEDCERYNDPDQENPFMLF